MWHFSRGLTYKQTARALNISGSTVRSHAHATYLCLNTSSAMQAVLICVRQGWLANSTAYQPDLPPINPEGGGSGVGPRGIERRRTPKVSCAQADYLRRFDKMLHERTEESVQRLDYSWGYMDYERRGTPPERLPHSTGNLDTFFQRLLAGLQRRY